MKETQFIDDRSLRNSYVGHFEVLEKVKGLLLLPDNETATVKQIAEYYSSYRTEEEKAQGLTDIVITEDAIQKIYQRNKEEFSKDGVMVKKSKDFLNWTKCPSQRGSITMLFENGQILTMSNAGIKVFPRRAILRIGMLLTGSEVSEEVRTQLLNIEEKTSNEVKTHDIDEEERLFANIGKTYASGNIEAFAKATMEYTSFQNRHIEKLKADNEKLENDNMALAGDILEWSDRKKMSAGIRRLKTFTSLTYADLWNELYRNLQYKYGISLKQRGKSPFIQHVREDEWDKVLKTFSAMCEAYGQSPTDMFKQTAISR